MIVRLRDDVYLDLGTGTRITVEGGAFPAVRWHRPSPAIDENAEFIAALLDDLAVATEEVLSRHRVGLAPADDRCRAATRTDPVCEVLPAGVRVAE